MSVDNAEEKWHKAKAAVDKSKYPEDDSYYAVVTKVFKSMMGESKIVSFSEWLKECDTSFTRQETP